MRSMKRLNLASSCEKRTDMMMSQITFEMDTANTGFRSTGAFFLVFNTHKNSSTSFIMRVSICVLREPM